MGDNTGTGWRALGDEQEVTPDRLEAAIALFDEEVAMATVRREHYWLAIVGFRVQVPMEDGTHLDRENIRTGPHIGCFICEEPYSERLQHRKCKGQPR